MSHTIFAATPNAENKAVIPAGPPLVISLTAAAILIDSSMLPAKMNSILTLPALTLTVAETVVGIWLLAVSMAPNSRCWTVVG